MPVKQDEPRTFNSAIVFYDQPVNESGDPQVVEMDAEDAIKFAKKLATHARWAAKRGGSCRIYLESNYLLVHTSLLSARLTKRELAAESKAAKAGGQ
jgi:hypothetical protein